MLFRNCVWKRQATVKMHAINSNTNESFLSISGSSILKKNGIYSGKDTELAWYALLAKLHRSLQESLICGNSF